MSAVSNLKSKAPRTGPTPGPWKSVGHEAGSNYVRVRGTRLGERFKVANVPFLPGYDFDLAEAEANANLIAAAPDMLDTLELICAMFAGYQGSITREADALKVAETAIAKARGVK